MKRLLLFLFALTLGGQSTRTVTLTWVDTVNPATTTYSVYRATGLCSGVPSFSIIATGLTVKTFQDSAVPPGNYCYTATATMNGIESAQAAPVGTAVTPFAPTGLSITINGGS